MKSNTVNILKRSHNSFFTSDWHLQHNNMRLGLPRPFSSVEEMNDCIEYNFYSQVKPGDNVYFLGDFAWNKQIGLNFLKKIPRNIHFHFIYGNHDKKMFKKSVLQEYCNSVQEIKDIKIGDYKLSLCHYPMLSFNCSHWNAIQLHGHHHGHIIEKKFGNLGKRVNVCVDLWDYYMLEFEQIIELTKNKINWDLIKK